MSNEVETGGEFFLAMAGGKDDISSVNWDGNEGFQTVAEAIDYAKDNAFDGGQYMVFRCTPIRFISRGPVRVSDYTAPKTSRKAPSE
jgi:hypothetical protein